MTYHPVEHVSPPTPPALPRYRGIASSIGPGTSQPGGFTVEEYAEWANLDIATATAVLDQAVIDGWLVLS